MRSESSDGPRTARDSQINIASGARRGPSASRQRGGAEKRNAARFEALVAVTGQLVWTTDSEGLAVEDSPGWRAFTGQSKKQFLGAGWRDAIHPDDRDRITRLCAEMLATDQTTRETECRLRHSGGGYRASHLRCAVVRAGSARELLFVATDVTERKRGNQERLRLLAFMDAITTNLGEGVYSVGLDGRLTFMNPEAERLLGWSETDLLGKDMHALTHFTDGNASDPGQIRCQLMEVMRTHDTYRGDVMFVRRNGALMPASVIASPIMSNGRVTGSVVAFNDNTERYQLEEELRLAAQAAAARASEHEAVFEAMGDAILVYDREGRFVHANALAIQAQITLSGQSNFRALSPEERARSVVVRDERGEPIPAEENPLSRALRGEHLVGSRSLDVSICTQEHGELWLQVSAAPMRDQRGDVAGAVLIYRSLTERRQLEREKAERARELETILDSMMDGVSVYRADGTLAYMNAAGRRMLEFDAIPDFFTLSADERGNMLDARDEQGRPIRPEDWIFTRILSGEHEAGAPDVDMWVRNLRGDRRVISFNGVPMRDADGAITGALQVYHDVTEQRRLERELTTRAALLSTVFEAMTDGVIVHALDASFVQHNAAARAILGLPEETKLLDMSDLARWVRVFDMHGQPLPRERWPVTRLLRGEGLTVEPDSDLTLRRADGTSSQVNVTGAAIRDDAGAIVGAVSVTRDVTERRRLEQRTQETLETLLEMAATAVNPPVAADGGDVSATKAVALRLMELARRVIGCDQAGIMRLDMATGTLEVIALVSRGPEMTRFWEEDVRHTRAHEYFAPEQLERFLAGEAVPVRMDAPRFKARYPDLAPVVLATPLQSEGKIIGLIGFGYLREHEIFTPQEIALAHAVARLAGVTIERDQLQRERAEARAAELAQREMRRRQDEFLSIAAHELKTPLTSIKANVQLAMRYIHSEAVPLDTPAGQVDTADVSAAALERADRQMLRIERLVDELLDLSRIQANRLALRREQRDLRAIVREAVEEQRLAWPQRLLSLALPGRPVLLWVDGDRVGQVVMNFLTNALKYSSEHEPVAASVRVRKGHVWVGVGDHGPGIPREEQARVWDRFHRVEGIEVAAGSDVGLGIGLYISRTIIEQHGGAVGVESVPGAGTTFWFTLPLGVTTPSQHAATGQ